MSLRVAPQTQSTPLFLMYIMINRCLSWLSPPWTVSDINLATLRIDLFPPYSSSVTMQIFHDYLEWSASVGPLLHSVDVCFAHPYLEINLLLAFNFSYDVLRLLMYSSSLFYQYSLLVYQHAPNDLLAREWIVLVIPKCEVITLSRGAQVSTNLLWTLNSSGAFHWSQVLFFAGQISITVHTLLPLAFCLLLASTINSVLEIRTLESHAILQFLRNFIRES